MKNKLFFIIGMRRSGTSILRTLISLHPEIENIEFEPHELLFACESIHIPRYNKSQYHIDTINRFKNHYDKWYSAKISLNAGIESLRYRRLEEKFDKPYYVFIKRNCIDTFKSWYKIDNKPTGRGVVPFEMYEPWWKHINHSFYDFIKKNPERGIIVEYEKLVKNADLELEVVWNMLNIKPIIGLNKYMIK